MSTGSKFLLFALAATFVAADVATAKAAPRPPLCTAGRCLIASRHRATLGNSSSC